LAYPSLRIEIAGYTDNVGDQRRNVWLSQTRADAVKLYLSRQGVARDRMVTRGYGPADPVASNATPEGRARNRRVELRRLQ
jgi:outer membrane protein OmpA-like peptidoglycan-associated protein